MFIVISNSTLDKQTSLYQQKPPSKKGDSISGIVGTIAMFVLAPIVALFLVAFVFQSYRVDGPSMEKTLFNNDRLIVNKLPKTWARLSSSHFIPKRYNVIVFSREESIGLNNYGERQLIKRVIGLPGDRVVVKDGKVAIFNQKHPEGYNPDQGKEYSKGFESTEGDVDVTVDGGEVFVMGDNRDNSQDSRIFGPVKSDKIVGSLILKIYPLSGQHSF